MVPELLSSNLCSLRCNVDRYLCMFFRKTTVVTALTDSH